MRLSCCSYSFRGIQNRFGYNVYVILEHCNDVVHLNGQLLHSLFPKGWQLFRELNESINRNINTLSLIQTAKATILTQLAVYNALFTKL